MKYFLQGLMLGISYVAPIGMQNLYVINAALRERRAKAYQVAFVTIFFDITLALACFFGIGALLKKAPVLQGIIMFLGSIIVIYIGISLLKSSPKISENIDTEKSLLNIIGDCFVVTWLNPQALIDGSLLLGAYHASIPEGLSKYFIIGFCLASFTWFTFLSTIVSIFHEKLNNNIIKCINIVCGIIIIFFGAKLGYSFIKSFL